MTNTATELVVGTIDNVFRIGDIKFTARGNRVIVREDEFRSGYECSTCGGSGKRLCTTCNGTAKSTLVPGARCASCRGTGSFDCNECGGKGGLLVVAEQSQRRPTTGTIVSVGPLCSESKVGDGVMFSNFAGYVVDLDRAGHRIVLRLLHENEILTGVEGHLELRSLKGKTEISVI